MKDAKSLQREIDTLNAWRLEEAKARLQALENMRVGIDMHIDDAKRLVARLNRAARAEE